MLYNKQLDSIRGIAVLMVVASHWIAKDIYALTPFRLSVLGSFGVDAFFVLSGFLITGILFNAGINIRTKSVPGSIVLKNFYLRRFLGIFAIVLLIVFIVYLLNHRIKYRSSHEPLYGDLYTCSTFNFIRYVNKVTIQVIWAAVNGRTMLFLGAGPGCFER